MQSSKVHGHNAFLGVEEMSNMFDGTLHRICSRQGYPQMSPARDRNLVFGSRSRHACTVSGVRTSSEAASTAARMALVSRADKPAGASNASRFWRIGYPISCYADATHFCSPELMRFARGLSGRLSEQGRSDTELYADPPTQFHQIPINSPQT